jgi:hypothetical protein
MMTEDVPAAAASTSEAEQVATVPELSDRTAAANNQEEPGVTVETVGERPIVKIEAAPPVTPGPKPVDEAVQETTESPTVKEHASLYSAATPASPAATTTPASRSAPKPNAARTADSDTSSTAYVDQVRAELFGWINNNKLDTHDARKLQILLKDYDSLKDKIVKLKSLLGRSAKAQREAKVDLEVTQKRLDHALRETDRLAKKIDRLANRPTHLELLADFETNFDRALLSAGQQQQIQQAGGQDTAPPTDLMTTTEQHPYHSSNSNMAVMDGLLLQELNDAKARAEKLETLHAAVSRQAAQLEADARDGRRERDDLALRVKHLELENRMAAMQAESAARTIAEQTASLAEMQMELDLVTRASVVARARAAQEESVLNAAKTDRQYVVELESKVAALQEWALAANESKTMAQERARLLETQLRALQHNTNNRTAALDNDHERVLFSHPGSLVVGAGMIGIKVVELSSSEADSIRLSERVILRWRFDLVQDDATITFNILKSKCETKQQQKEAEYLVKDRVVTGGAAGETEHAFAVQNSCTLLWNNGNAWLRPKTIRYNIEAVAVED